MTTIESAERAEGVAPSHATQIWGSEERGCAGKITRRRLLAVGAAAGCAALALGLYLGLANSSGEDSVDRIVGQAVDPNAIGCFIDERHSRVMEDVLRDPEGMVPEACNKYCEDKGYAFYALQWGQECWCGDEDVEVDRFGVGVCDYPCPGDKNLVCGGYLTFTAYEVGAEATTPTPTPPVEIDECKEPATVRFGPVISYFQDGGCATLTLMYEEQQAGGREGPVYVLDENDEIVDDGSPTGYWLLAGDLRIEGGATLYVHGTSIGGDADVLRILSEGEDAFYELRGYGGSLSFKSTKVTSWDMGSGKEQTKYEGGRSFINCVSEERLDNPDTCPGAAKNNMGLCRMDIIDSTMGNLGWFDAESYGLTWKVRGFCSDLSNPEVFERTNVYGDIKGSDIYGMYYGMYTYGHQGGVWTNNKMHDNILYGFDPHDDSDELTIANNEVYGNGNHGIIASKRCNNVKIYDNEVYDGGESAAGIFLHRSSDDAEVYGNYVHDMQDAGIAIMESMNADIYDNTITNVKYGIRFSLGSAGNQIYDNTFDGCSSSGFYTYEGSDPPDVSNGRPSGNVFTTNTISNTKTGVKINQGDDNQFIDNTFTGTEVLEFKDTDDTTWRGNSLPSGVCAEGDAGFTSDSDSVSSCD